VSASEAGEKAERRKRTHGAQRDSTRLGDAESRREDDRGPDGVDEAEEGRELHKVSM